MHVHADHYTLRAKTVLGIGLLLPRIVVVCSSSVADHWRATSWLNVDILREYDSIGVHIEELPPSIVEHLQSTWEGVTGGQIG